MQNGSLRVTSILDFAATVHGDVEVVSRESDGSCSRVTYSQLSERARRLAGSLLDLGLQPFDRVATLAMNTHRHLELQYACAGAGLVWHPINPRLSIDQICYVVDHAEDVALFFEPAFWPIIERIATNLRSVRFFVKIDGGSPCSGLAKPLLWFDDLVDKGPSDFEWVSVNEEDASSLSYTSGTTGNPKGVLYSNRSDVLHALTVCSGNGLAISSQDCAMAITPMFHANGAWGLTHAAPMAGAKIVFPGSKMDPASLAQLIWDEAVTVSGSVPTIATALATSFATDPRRAGNLQRFVLAGSAPSPALIAQFEELGVDVLHIWGMTEMSPTGTAPIRGRRDKAGSAAELKLSQGSPIFGVEMRSLSETGTVVPRDGVSQGRLQVRGPWIINGYFRDEKPAVDAYGWFDTGDLATIESCGRIRLTDRAKDVIKSGGEWISSIDLENIVAGCPGVEACTVVGIAHPRWEERPLLLVVRGKQSKISADAIRNYLKDRIAKWWMPDAILFVDELPIGATGKVLKRKLREEFSKYFMSPDKGGAVDALMP
jgi:acyl-CoA synthetase (AMP-forming)/AMP-acid ligase II